MRQAYVTAMVDPHERVAASAYTSTARYAIRPAGPVLAGVAQHVALALPLLIAGTIKSIYDLTLWSWLRHVPLHDGTASKEVSDDRLLANRPSTP